MNTDWESGDVALVRWGGDIKQEDVMLRNATGNGWCGVFEDVFDRDDEIEFVRPLVVIDPDDAEQVKRLAELGGHHPEALAAALREFASPTPPKCAVELTLSVNYDDGKGYHEALTCQLPQDHAGFHEDSCGIRRTSWDGKS